MATAGDNGGVTPSSPAPAGGPTGISSAQVVALARKLLGRDYVYGAAGPSTFDCSGLAQFVFKQLGSSIPRTSEEQFRFGTPIDAASALPGDLVFFGGNGYDGTPTDPGHVGIYIGNNQMINAPHTGAQVRIDSVGGNVGFRRMPAVAFDDALGQITGSVGAVAGAGLGGLFSWPGDIVGFFTSATADLEKMVGFFSAFFKPSTYVRLGAGILGTALLVAGLVLLAQEAKG